MSDHIRPAELGDVVLGKFELELAVITEDEIVAIQVGDRSFGITIDGVAINTTKDEITSRVAGDRVLTAGRRFRISRYDTGDNRITESVEVAVSNALVIILRIDDFGIVTNEDI
ncbi:MAG: hypothetical protein RQ754_03645, partial [Desulfuromonadales bacterium]|nr:hypothetical protein [Desulfuromonadales bacterium]